MLCCILCLSTSSENKITTACKTNLVIYSTASVRRLNLLLVTSGKPDIIASLVCISVSWQLSATAGSALHILRHARGRLYNIYLTPQRKRQKAGMKGEFVLHKNRNAP